MSLSDPSSRKSGDLFFGSLVRGYVEENPRFVRREWLAARLDEKLGEPGKRFVLLTAEPGAGKSVFMAQLAHDHPGWLRYFIRRDQREVLADVSDKSLLLRIGYQLAARHPDLFTSEALRLSVVQKIGQVADQGEVVGAEVKRLIASPFYQKVLEIEQQVRANQGTVVGLRVEELVVESRLLSAEDLLQLALIHPARALERVDPGKQVVILIDALDEIRYHPTAENVLAWLTNCPELPENIRFVLTSRPPDEALKLFCEKQASRLSGLTIAKGDAHVKQDIDQFITRLIAEPALGPVLSTTEGGAQAFARRATEMGNGNLGYLDALARGIDQGLARTDSEALQTLLSMKELPTDLEGLYTFFLDQIKASVARERIELRDAETGETYDKPVWPAVYDRILGVLAVAMEPLGVDLLVRLGGIRAERVWVSNALDRLQQFMDAVDGRYRLYHATVAEFLTAERTHHNTETADLYQDARQRHRQIAAHYWVEHSKDWSACTDAYALRNLARHLRATPDNERLQRLICKGWMEAKFIALGSDESFAEDIQLAISIATDAADLARLVAAIQALRSKALAYNDEDLKTITFLGRVHEARHCCLMRVTRGAKIDGLLSLVMAAGTNTALKEALLDDAAAIARAEDRDAQEETNLIESVAIAFAREGKLDRAREIAGTSPRVLEAVALALSASARFDDALRVARSIQRQSEGSILANALGLIGRDLARIGDARAGEIIEEALVVAREQEWAEGKATAICDVAAALASIRDPDAARLIEEALAVARSLPNERRFVGGLLDRAGPRGAALHRLATRLAEAGMATRALEVVRIFPDPQYNRGLIEELKAVCDVAAKLARIGDDHVSIAFDHAKALAARLQDALEKMRDKLRGAEADADTRYDVLEYEQPLVVLACSLADAGDMNQAEATARALKSSPQRLRALRHLAFRLAESRDPRAAAMMQEVGDLSRAIGDPAVLRGTLPGVALGLARARCFQEAERAARCCAKGWERWNAMRNVGFEMAKAGLLVESEALAESIDCGEPHIPRQLIMSSVVKGWVRAGRLDKATSALSRSGIFSDNAISELAAGLVEVGHPRAAFETVQTFLQNSPDVASRAYVLRGLGSALASVDDDASDELLQMVIGELRNCVATIGGIQHRDRARAVSELALLLLEAGDGESSELFAEAVACTRSISDETERADLQGELASSWAGAGHAEHAYRLALSIEDGYARDKGVRRVLSELSVGDYLAFAQRLIDAIGNGAERREEQAECLVRTGRLREAFEELSHFRPDNFITALARWLPWLERPGGTPASAILREALSVMAWVNDAYATATDAIFAREIPA